MHHWPLSNLSDVAGNRHLLGGLNFEYVSDRHNKPASAVHLQRGFLQAPTGAYFYGDFSITAWLQLRAHQPWLRLVDFGNDRNTDNVFFTAVASSNMSSHLALGSYHSVADKSSFVSSAAHLRLDLVWHHVAVTLKGPLVAVYVDGRLVEQSASPLLLRPRNQIRSHNFIGRSNGHTGSRSDEDAQAVIDELKIYQGALSQRQVAQQFLRDLIQDS